MQHYARLGGRLFNTEIRSLLWKCPGAVTRSARQPGVGDGPDVQFRVGTGDRTEAAAEVGVQAIVTLLVGILSLLGGAYVLARAAGFL